MILFVYKVYDDLLHVAFDFEEFQFLRNHSVDLKIIDKHHCALEELCDIVSVEKEFIDL